MIFYRFICIIIGYALGNISFGYLYGKSKNINLQKEGSGNIGTTNTLRVLGVKAGAFALFCDCMKAVLAAFLSYLIFHYGLSLEGEDVRILELYAAFGALIGHDFPVVLRFHGGKGVASGLGFLLVTLPHAVPLALLIFIITVALTRYVSLGSILAAFSVILQAILFVILRIFPFTSYRMEALFFIVAMPILVILLHHQNIDRLIHHRENKFSFHPSVKKEDKNG